MDIARGGSPRPINEYITNDYKGVNWIKIGDTEKGGKYISNVKEKIKPEGVLKSRMVYKGDFLLTNSMSFGRPYILKVDGCIHDGWLVISNTFNAYTIDFLYYLLSSKFAYYQFCQSVSGAVVKNLNSDKVSNSLFPIPPLNEQKTIVKKIVEVEPLIDKYEKSETQLSELNISIKEQLKKSILQYAIQGKLIEQDPNDEPASILLQQIKEDKERLVLEGKIKKDKNESYIFRRDNSYYEKLSGIEKCINDEIPFNIPNSWEWIRLKNIGVWGAGATPLKGNLKFYENGNIPWLLTGDLNNGLIYEVPNNVTELALKNTSLKLNPAGSVLIAMYGATIGKLGILKIPVTTNQACCACQPYSFMFNQYLFYFLMYYKPFFIKQGEGGAQPNISKEKIERTLIPLPPYKEQIEMCSGINELLNILKQSIF